MEKTIKTVNKSITDEKYTSMDELVKDARRIVSDLEAKIKTESSSLDTTKLKTTKSISIEQLETLKKKVRDYNDEISKLLIKRRQEYDDLQILSDRLIRYDESISNNYKEICDLRTNLDILVLEKERLEGVVEELKYEMRVKMQHVEHIDSEINDLINVNYRRLFNFEKKLIQKLWRLRERVDKRDQHILDKSAALKCPIPVLSDGEKQPRKGYKTEPEIYTGQVFTFMTDYDFMLHLEDNRRPRPWKEYDLTSTKTEEPEESSEEEPEVIEKPKKLKGYMMAT